MTGNPGLVEFLLARLDDEARPTFELVPYECPPGCCAPAGWVGHRCLLCGTTEWGGTVQAITGLAREHEESQHRRSYIAAKRRIIELRNAVASVVDLPPNEELRRAFQAQLEALDSAIALLAAPFSSHPDWQPEWSTE